MNTETISPVNEEQVKNNPPTTLHLFRYKGFERDQLQAKVSAGAKLEENFTRTNLSLGKLHAGTNARLDRLSQTSIELLEQLDNNSSSITCGAVYLKMHDELHYLSPQDFMTFFRQCLAVNTSLCELERAKAENAKDQTTLFRIINLKNNRQLPADDKIILGKMPENPPCWFGDDKRAWKAFVYLHANFVMYLNHDMFQSFASDTGSLKDMLDRVAELPGFTKKGELPDWFSEDGERVPTKEEVEEELEEDKEQKIKNINALQKINEQGSYLTTASTDKTNKAMARLLGLAQETFSNSQNFTDMIIFLEIANKVNKTNTFNLPFDKTIKDYTESQGILVISEPIALYIEKKLLEGKIIQSTQDPIAANFTDLFTRLLEYLKDKQDSSLQNFQELRNTNKKAFGTLNYDIKPFLEILSVEELSFLQELPKAYRGTAIEQLIWDMAGLISSRIKQGEVQLTRSLRGALNYLSKFTATFLKTHSNFAYREIYKSLQDNFFEQEELEPLGSLVATSLQEEIESTTEEITQGNLAGWHIFYTDSKSSDEKNLTEIGGKTLEERELALQELFVKEKVSFSIKPGSIVRAFEWLVTVPEEVEQVRIRKNIGEEVFRKIKRGNTRIFYQMSLEKKNLIFFVHQKKAWSYGF